jgi:hypothetical protein
LISFKGIIINIIIMVKTKIKKYNKQYYLKNKFRCDICLHYYDKYSIPKHRYSNLCDKNLLCIQTIINDLFN